ncbi:MAG: tripartite tricarboxylate transporter TctB family protein [Desulfobacterota bacterium]|nr:tripartite tricarboxylate transporter TctB family protein [Thermodesulfobacteriota bacterium]
MILGELIISGVIFFGSLFLFFEAQKFEGHDVYAKLGPAYWPEFLLVCLMGLSLLVAVDALRQKRKGGEEAKGAPKWDKGKGRLLLAIGFIVLYFLLLKVVGFIALTPFFLIAFMYLLGERKKAWMIGVSLGMTVLIVYVFTKAMYVPLPRGTGIFLDFSHLFY